MIHKITPSVDSNLWLERFDGQLDEPNNQNLIKAPLCCKTKELERQYKNMV